MKRKHPSLLQSLSKLFVKFVEPCISSIFVVWFQQRNCQITFYILFAVVMLCLQLQLSIFNYKLVCYQYKCKHLKPRVGNHSGKYIVTTTWSYIYLLGSWSESECKIVAAITNVSQGRTGECFTLNRSSLGSGVIELRCQGISFIILNCIIVQLLFSRKCEMDIDTVVNFNQIRQK